MTISIDRWTCPCLAASFFLGKPDAGNPPVRFDEGRGGQPPRLLYSGNLSVVLLVLPRGWLGMDPWRALARIVPIVVPRRWLGTDFFSTSHRTSTRAGDAASPHGQTNCSKNRQSGDHYAHHFGGRQKTLLSG